MCSLGYQNKCHCVAVSMFALGILDVITTCFDNKAPEAPKVIALVAWIPLFIAAGMLIYGAYMDKPVMLKISIVLAVIGAFLWIIANIWILLHYFGILKEDYFIVFYIIGIIAFIVMIVFFVYAPCRYLEELEQ